MNHSRSGLLLAAALLAVAACDRSDSREAAARHVVEIRAFEYHPESVSVSPGDTVVWVNSDAVPHTVTSAGGAWDSRSIPAGGSWTLVVTESAIAGYVCEFHPTMSATLIRNEE